MIIMLNIIPASDTLPPSPKQPIAPVCLISRVLSRDDSYMLHATGSYLQAHLLKVYQGMSPATQ